MLPFTIKIGNQKQKINIPTSWKEVTETQALALSEINSESPAEILEAITGIPSKYLKELKSRKFDELYYSTSHLLTSPKPDFTKSIKPKLIEIRGRKFSANINPEKILYGYLESIRLKLQEIESEANEKKPRYYDYCSYYIAFALAGQMFTKMDEDGKEVGIYDEEKALRLVEDIRKMPMQIVFPVGCFFLQKLLIYFTSQQTSLKLVIVKTKSMQEFARSKNLGFFSRLKILLKVIGRKRNFT